MRVWCGHAPLKSNEAGARDMLLPAQSGICSRGGAQSACAGCSATHATNPGPLRPLMPDNCGYGGAQRGRVRAQMNLHRLNDRVAAAKHLLGPVRGRGMRCNARALFSTMCIATQRERNEYTIVGTCQTRAFHRDTRTSIHDARSCKWQHRDRGDLKTFIHSLSLSLDSYK